MVKPAEVVRKPITRADVRTAVIEGVRIVKSNPRSVRLTEGQRRQISKTG